MDNIKFNIKKDIEDVRDVLYGDRHRVGLYPPASHDLRSKCSPIVDQGALASCTANAIVSGLREYILINDEKKSFVKLSRLFIYWWEREFEGTIDIDAGASIRDGMKAITKYGTCTETTDVYDITKFKEKPTDQEMQEALNYKLPGYQRVIGLDQIKDAIIHEHPVVISMTLYKSFQDEYTKQTGIVDIPFNDEPTIGGHAMCIVGYDDNLNNGSFIVRNSWGESWGDKGYCYIPYEMINDIMDAWTVKYGKKYLNDYFPFAVAANTVGCIKKKLKRG